MIDKRKFRRVTAVSAAVLAIFAALFAIGMFSHFRFSQARYDGSVKVEGLTGSVTILRDRHAIPHILARSHRDALFGLGYAIAQDRLWQMAFIRRLMQGRLAEVMGSDAVPTDIYMRTLGLYDYSEQTARKLDPKMLALLQSYADGVNAYLATRRGALPIEFMLAGTGFAPWKPADSVAVLKYMELSLSGNLSGELARAQLASILTKRQIEDLFPPAAGDPANPLPDYLSLFAKKKSAAREVPDTTASNNWAVSGLRSITGAPLLATDPHLQMTIPSIWYLAHLSFPGEDIIGAALPGGPGMTLGRNRNIAWGMTNTGPDTQDLYLERIDPKDKNFYLTPTGRARFVAREEKIVVRFGWDKTIIIRSTRHGPVISDNDEKTAAILPDGMVLAARWTVLTPEDHTINWMLKVNRARNTKEFLAAMPDYLAPMQNIVYAGRDGKIGLYLPGKIPLRKPENDSLGLVPGKGWDARYDWSGYIPANQMPRIDDPQGGQIATANNRTVPENYPHTLTREWEEPYRFERADKMLKDTRRHSLETFRTIQLDTYDGYAAALTPLLLRANAWKGEEAEVVRALSRWNFRMETNKPEPLIFAAWSRALVKRVIADEMGDDFETFWTHRPTLMLRVLRNEDGAGRWCNDVTTEGVESCANRIAASLRDALDELKSDYGGNRTKWRWGAAHRAVMAHLPFENIPGLRSIFSRDIEAAGGAFTLRRGDYKPGSWRPFAASHGSGFRALIDIANPDASLYVIATGQSGNIFSPHYDDLMPLWARGRYVRIPQSRDEVDRIAEYKLTLQPGE